MSRALSLYLPTWSVDLVRRQQRLNFQGRPDVAAHPAILLVRTVADRQVVAQCCERAAASGVRPGMNLSYARALLPLEHTGRLMVAPHDPHRDTEALRSLALWATRYFSPTVAVDEPGEAHALQLPGCVGFGLLMDITGCQRLFHGERRLVYRVAESVRRFRVRCRVASAPTFGAAWALSRFAPDDITIIGRRGLLDALRPLPLMGLRIDPATEAALHEVAITTIGELLPIGRGELRNRFGEQLVRRLEQAVGDAPERIDPVRPVEPPRAARAFDGPVKQLEAIVITVRELLVELCDQMLSRQCGARRIELTLTRVDAPPVVETATLSRPNRDDRHLWSLFSPRVEKLNLGFGVDAVEMIATRTGLLRHEQAAVWADRTPTGTDAEFGELLDVLANRLGRHGVLHAAARESYIPERRFRFMSAIDPAPRTTPAAMEGDRPTVLFDPPEPASVVLTTPEGPVLQITWRGELRRIVASIGPERIEPEWWRIKPRDCNPWALPRDYFKVQIDTGAWAWLFRDLQTGRWFVHGVWG